MATPLEQLTRLRGYRRSVQAGDPRLAEETGDLEIETTANFEVRSDDLADQIELESIAMRRERPVLAIYENVVKPIFIDQADSAIWGERLAHAKPLLDAAIPAVGRIDLTGGALSWVGTGWLVAEDVVVTNRHVAREFVQREGDRLTFKMGEAKRMTATLDLLQEIDNPRQLVFELVEPLHIEEGSGPDVAFFSVRQTSGATSLAKPIKLSPTIRKTEAVATIGYPAYDSRIPEPALMRRIYGDVFDKKRLAPGGVTQVDDARIWHNCTTLGGNSGSVVLDLETGEAMGLHFSGTFLTTNYAVRADVVGRLLSGLRFQHTVRRREIKAEPRVQASVDAAPRESGRTTANRQGAVASLRIPLVLNVSLNIGRYSPAAAWRFASPAIGTDTQVTDVIDTEAVASDYSEREGYRADFLGAGAAVALPTVTRGVDNILEFDVEGRTERELRYQHFSVVMNRGRRMCFFSAVNIDGNRSRKSPRVAWKWDPRIPRAQQVMHECYGSPPKFSRGHMTRREDPGWGTPEVARLGNEDSMHITNTVPQMQAFNAPIWLALEDYALQHAREDAMKISVFTGPYFGKDDPEMYGVRIPLAFWKVIAFVHDDTGRLCATGYEMDQESALQPEEEFVFGAFTSPQRGTATQVPIRSIERRCGIRFDMLAALDPLAGEDEGLESNGIGTELMMLEQIRYVR